MNFVLNIVSFLLLFSGFVYFSSETGSAYYAYLRYGLLLLSFVPLLFTFADIRARKIPELTKAEAKEQRLASKRDARKARAERRGTRRTY